jgi:predicted metal-dependent HD superfamily phosphohydrolase
VNVSPGRFAAACRRLGATGLAEPLATDLLARYAEPGRAYHGVEHLHDCLAQLDAAPPDDADRDRVEAALWFHDAVYDPRTGDNEARSAELARTRLSAIGVPGTTAEAVAGLVLLTRHLAPPESAEGRLLCDVDLSVLGRDPAAFDRYEAGIRAEYAWVPEAVYRRERATLLRRLVDRYPLYTTPYFRERYEARARANLARSLAALEGR